MKHSRIDPAILYFGTPVALLSTVADDGTPNTAPMSTVFWLGQTAVLGMGGRSQTAQNLLATGECVINLPSVDLVSAVDALALTTGRSPVPAGKTHPSGGHAEQDRSRSVAPTDHELSALLRAHRCSPPVPARRHRRGVVPVTWPIVTAARLNASGKEQYICHMGFAGVDHGWNMEPWRAEHSRVLQRLKQLRTAEIGT